MKKFSFFVTILLVCYPTWLYNTSAICYKPGLLIIAAISIFLSLYSRRKALKEVVVDPVLFCNLLFLIYLFVQYINSSAILTPATTLASGVALKPVLYDFLPFSRHRELALTCLYYSVMTYAIFLSIRHVFTDADSRKKIVYWTLGNAFTLAIVGFIQLLYTPEKIYGLYTTNGDYVFASFGYENHGGAYYTLMTAVALGVLLQLMSQKIQWRSFGKACLLLLVIPLFSLAIFTTHTRVCYIELTFLAGCFYLGVIYFIFTSKVKKTISLSIFILFTVIILGIFTTAMNQPSIKSEVVNMSTNVGKFIKRQFSVRTWQWQAANKIWRDYPLYGTGTNSLRYIQRRYLKEEELKWDSGAGKANTHNDFFQFLSEYGLIGVGILALLISALVSDCMRKENRTVLFLFVLLGVLLNIAHSLVDLPYRSGSILMVTCALLTIFSQRDKITVAPRQFKFFIICHSFLLVAVLLLSFDYLSLRSKSDASDFSSIDEVKWESYSADKKLSIQDRLTENYLMNQEDYDLALAFAQVMRFSGNYYESLTALEIIYDKFPKDVRIMQERAKTKRLLLLHHQ